MANFQTAPKLRIVNTPDYLKTIALQKKASGAFEPITPAATADPVADRATDAAATDLLKLVGIADLFKGKVTSAIKTLHIPGQVQTSTLTVTANTVTPGQEFTIKLVTKTQNLEHEFVRFDGHNQKDRIYNYIVKAGDTADTIAARIAELIEYDEYSDAYKFVDVSVATNVVTLTGLSEGWEFKCYFEGEAVESGNIGIVEAVTAQAFEGRNVWRQLNVKRLQTPNRTYPYATGWGVNPEETPIKGATYTHFVINFDVERTDLSGPSVHNQSAPTGNYAIELFLNDATCTAEIEEIDDWLIANASRFEKYNSTTPAQAIAAETPAVTTN